MELAADNADSGLTTTREGTVSQSLLLRVICSVLFVVVWTFTPRPITEPSEVR